MPSVDPYLDETTGDLRNLLDAKSSAELKLRETQIVFANELELESSAIPRTNDFDELLLIHEHLFRHIYDWAGNIRTVDIKKNTESGEFFLPVDKISVAANYVFDELAKDQFLIGLSMQEFTARLAYHYDQLNYIHPFREGNGRTQRLFWSRVAHDAGFDIDWSLVIGDENDEASRQGSEDMDTTALVAMFERIITESL